MYARYRKLNCRSMTRERRWGEELGEASEQGVLFGDERQHPGLWPLCYS